MSCMLPSIRLLSSLCSSCTACIQPRLHRHSKLPGMHMIYRVLFGCLQVRLLPRHPPVMDPNHQNLSRDHPRPARAPKPACVCALEFNRSSPVSLVLSPLSLHPRCCSPFLYRQSMDRKNASPVRLGYGFRAMEMRTGKQRIDCCVLGRAGRSRRVQGKETRVAFAEGFRNFDFKACSPEGKIALLQTTGLLDMGWDDRVQIAHQRVI